MFVTGPDKGYGQGMLSAREVGITAERELYRNIRSSKGIAMFALFLLGGLVFSVLVSTIIQFLLAKLATRAGLTEIPAELQRQLFEQYLIETYPGEAIPRYLGESPAVLYFLYQGTLVFLPLLVLLVGFDQIAGEVQHRTIRYSAGRATRASIVLGKALGVWGVIAVMILVLHLTVWVLVLVRGAGTAGQILAWGPRFWLLSVLCAAAYVGFGSIVSAFFRTPIVALFVGAGAGAALWLSYKVAWLAGTSTFSFARAGQIAEWAFPNNYEQLLVSPSVGTVLGGAALFIGWGALCVAASVTIVSRRDI